MKRLNYIFTLCLLVVASTGFGQMTKAEQGVFAQTSDTDLIFGKQKVDLSEFDENKGF